MSWRDRTGEIASVIDSGNTARTMLGKYLELLSTAYGLSDSYQVGPIGEQPTSQNREYLDGIRIRAEADFKLLQPNNDPVEDRLKNQVAFDIYSIETATNQTIDLFSGNTALGDLADSIWDNLPDLPKPPPGGWSMWIVVGLVAVVVLVVLVKR